MKVQSKGIIVILGGFMIHLVLGTLYMWGNINTYVLSYFCWYGDYGVTDDCSTCRLSIGDIGIVFPLIFTALCCMMSFGVPLGKLIGFRLVAIIGAVLLPGGILASSFTKSFVIFSLLYGILFGFVAGSLYMIPFNLSHRYFPHKRGISSGLISSGFGGGSLIFSSIVKAIVNPHNLPDTNNCFPKEVAENLPTALQVLSGCYFAVMLTGAILMFKPSEEEEEQVKDELSSKVDHSSQESLQLLNEDRAPTIIEALKTPKLYLLLLQTVFLSSTGILVAAIYNPYGELSIQNDTFLVWTGNAGFLSNFFSRIFWGYLMDVTSFRVVGISMSLISLAMISTITFITTHKATYMIWIVISFFAYGGLYSVIPTLSSKIFGKNTGLVVFGVISLGFTVSSWIEYFIIKYTVTSDNVDGKKKEFNTVFYSYIAGPILAIIMLIVFQYQKPWNQPDEQASQQLLPDIDEDQEFQTHDKLIQNKESFEQSNEKAEVYSGYTTDRKKVKDYIKDSSYIAGGNSKIGGAHPGYNR